MLKNISVLFVLFLSLTINAQVIEKRFNAFEKADGSGAVQTNDGGYIIAGRDYDDVLGKTGALIFKVNTIGEVVWKAFYHQVDGTSTTFSNIIEMADGTIVVMGSSIKYNTPDPGNVTSTIVMKFTADGEAIWSKSFANPGELLWNTAIGSHITPYTDGGVIISINISSVTCGGAALLRLNEDGDLIWSKNYHGAASGRDILVKDTGEIYFTGSVVLDSEYKAHFTQVDPATGTQIMSRLYQLSEGSTYGEEIVYDGEHIYLAGSLSDHMFLIKLLDDGSMDAEWSIELGEAMQVGVSAEIIDDQIVLGGMQSGASHKSILAMLDFDGTLVEDYIFSNVDGSIEVKSISATSDNEIVIAGVFSHAGSFNSDVYFGKSAFPLASSCNLTVLDVPVNEASILITVPDFFVSDDPIELPIDLQTNTLVRMDAFDYCSLSSIDAVQAELGGISIYPNPTQNLVQITSDAPLKDLKIYDALGKLVITKKFENNLFGSAMDVSALPNGVYLMVLNTDLGIVNKRLVIA